MLAQKPSHWSWAWRFLQDRLHLLAEKNPITASIEKPCDCHNPGQTKGLPEVPSWRWQCCDWIVYWTGREVTGLRLQFIRVARRNRDAYSGQRYHIESGVQHCPQERYKAYLSWKIQIKPELCIPRGLPSCWWASTAPFTIGCKQTVVANDLQTFWRPHRSFIKDIRSLANVH